MIRVLEIISDTNIGGAGVLLHSRIKHSSEFDYTVLLPKNSELKKRLANDNIKFIEMDSCSDKSFEFYAIFEISKIIKKIKPDIVNTHGCASARIAARLCGVSVRIYTRHCAFELSGIASFSVSRLFVRAVNKILSHRIIAVADAAKNNLVEMGVNENNISVIINGVEGIRKLSDAEKSLFRKQLEIDNSDTVISICARLEPYKDHACFLRAAAILLKQSPKYRFLIIGEGSMRKYLESMAENLGIKNAVAFIGFVEDVSPYLNISDISVNCSIGTETSSLAISESMSIGVPVVASDFGGNPYMVNNGVNGFLYKKGNSHDLSEKIKMIAENKSLYEKMSNNAEKRFFEELNIENTVRKTEELYNCLYNLCKK